MIFPLALAMLQVLVDGAPVRSYRPAYIERGRVMVPVTMIDTMASSAQTSGSLVVARRGDRFAQARVESGYVAIGPLVRTLGAAVRYDAQAKRLYVRFSKEPVVTPTPFNAAVPQSSARSLFTPVPTITPKPTVSGKPLPRRTPPAVTVKVPGTPPPARRPR